LIDCRTIPTDKAGLMRTTRRNAIAIMIALATLLAIDVAPASAITLQRTWTAKVGSSGVNGKVVLKAYTNGVGSIHYSLRGLNQQYRQEKEPLACVA
jgi:hypothetical protein